MPKVVPIEPSPQRAGAHEPAELVEACRRGEPAALEAVFRAHGPYLERLLGRIVGPRLDVEDLVQSTFTAAIVAFPRFRGEAQVRTWLARIAVRTAHDRLRRADHRRRASLPVPETVGDESQDGRRAERALDARRKLERLYYHLGEIGPRKRIAFVLHVIEGHSMEEVAALMGAARPATKSRVFWARRELLKRAARDPLLKDLAAEAVLRASDSEVSR